MSLPRIRTVDDLDPTEFENFTYDILQSSGFRHLVWRTPGSDGGRDIEGEFFQTDISGYTDVQKWYIECKRYHSSIDWPTVWNKVSYADANRANFLLLVTNSNPSPACESQIARWNSDHRLLKIRIWRGYDLLGVLNAFPIVAIKYGLSMPTTSIVADFLDLGAEISKISQATYAALEFGTDLRPGLEASASLAELLSHRVGDLATFGRFVSPSTEKIDALYEWSEIIGETSFGIEITIRAILSTLKLVTKSERIQVAVSPAGFEVRPVSAKQSLNPSGLRLLQIACLWSDLEVTVPLPGAESDVYSFFYRRQ